MESTTKVCIVNSHTDDGWYSQGQSRLKRSLIYHGYAHDFYFTEGWANDSHDKECPYTIKASAMEEVAKLGYDILIWIDCSFWAIGDLTPIFDKIIEDGYYFWGTNFDFNCAQVCSDKCLEYFGITRDEAEEIQSLNSGFWGVNLHGEIGQTVLNRFIKASKDGVFHGSRHHDHQSRDKRFLYHRQDQSVLSLIVGEMGLKTHGNEHIMYYKREMPENIVLTLRGL